MNIQVIMYSGLVRIYLILLFTNRHSRWKLIWLKISGLFRFARKTASYVSNMYFSIIILIILIGKCALGIISENQEICASG